MSTLKVTTVTSPDANTDLILASGNSQSGQILISANGAGVTLKSNSTVNAITINTTSWTFSNNPVFSTNTFTVGTASYFVANGNLGIGTNSPTYKLDVNGTTYIRNSLYLSASNWHYIADRNAFYSSSGTGLLIQAPDFNSKIVLRNASGSELVNFVSNGYIGIGTSVPPNFLHIDGVNTNTATFLSFGDSNNQRLKLGWNVTGILEANVISSQIVTGQYGELLISSRTNYPSWIALHTNNTANTASERMRITAGGNVGIACTAPSYTLDVAGTGRFYGAAAGASILYLGASRTNDYNFINFMAKPGLTNSYTLGGIVAYSSLVSNEVRVGTMEFAKEGTGSDNKTYFDLATHDGTTYASRFHISSDGNCSLGTTNPTAKLQLDNTITDNKIHIYNSGSGDVYGLGLRSSMFMIYSGAGGSADGGVYIGNYNGSTFNESMRVRNSGLVTMPKQPSFSVRRASTNVTSGNVVTYSSTISADPSSAVNTINLTNGRYTAPAGGKYHFNFVAFSDSGSSVPIEIFMRINGSIVARNYHATTVTSYNALSTISIVLNLSTNDYVDIYLNQGSLHGSENCYFSGFLIG